MAVGRPICYIKLQQLVIVATIVHKYYDCPQCDCAYHGWLSIISYMQALNVGDLLLIETDIYDHCKNIIMIHFLSRIWEDLYQDNIEIEY